MDSFAAGAHVIVEKPATSTFEGLETLVRRAQEAGRHLIEDYNYVFNHAPQGIQCESASNLDPTPVEHQIIEAELELLISGVFDRRPTVTPLFSRKGFNCNAL